VIDQFSLATGLVLAVVGVQQMVTGSPGPALLFLLLGTGLAGSAGQVPAWGRVALFFALLLATVLLIFPVL
jgi:hypothetical protein